MQRYDSKDVQSLIYITSWDSVRVLLAIGGNIVDILYISDMARRVKRQYLTSYSCLFFFLGVLLIGAILGFVQYQINYDYTLIVTSVKSPQVALDNFERYKKYYIFGASLFSLFILAFCRVMVNHYTKQQRTNAELSRLERLNLVGEMAAGIGHEIRNPMTVVRGYLQMFQRKEIFAEYRNQLDTMIEELDRANAIITEYLSLAKNKSTELSMGNINSVLDIIFPLLKAAADNYGHILEMETNSIPDICMNGNELRQLLLNLVQNGFEAMQPTGTLTIKSYVENDEVILAVRDTGKGIPKSMLDKIGTPFATTKDKGTGLGLAVCYQIAVRHKAKIDVKTSSNGTTFYVKFKFDRVNWINEKKPPTFDIMEIST